MTEARLINLAHNCAKAFHIPLKNIWVTSVMFDGGRSDKTAFGQCDLVQQTIWIRVTSNHTPPRPLSEACIIDTLAHELAHLFEWNHTKRHKGLVRVLKEWLFKELQKDPASQTVEY